MCVPHAASTASRVGGERQPLLPHIRARAPAACRPSRGDRQKCRPGRQSGRQRVSARAAQVPAATRHQGRADQGRHIGSSGPVIRSRTAPASIHGERSDEANNPPLNSVIELQRATRKQTRRELSNWQDERKGRAVQLLQKSSVTGQGS